MIAFFYPPRPKSAIPPKQLGMYEAEGGWLVQGKLDGQRALVCFEGSEIVARNRRGKVIPLSSAVKRELSKLKITAPTCLDGEYMRGIDTFGFFDLLYYKQHLLGVGQLRRLEMLRDICLPEGKPLCCGPFATVLSPHLWMVNKFDSGFAGLYRETVSLQHVHGLVLRRGDSVLQNAGISYYEVDWQIRCRNPAKSFDY